MSGMNRYVVFCLNLSVHAVYKEPRNVVNSASAFCWGFQLEDLMVVSPRPGPCIALLSPLP